MLRLFSCLLPFLATLACGLSSDLHAQTAEPDDKARVIVKLKEFSPLLRQSILSVSAARAARAAALAQRIGIEMRSGSDVDDRSQVMFASGLTSAELAKRLAAQPDVEYAVPDKLRRIAATPNDPLYFAGGPNGPPAGQWYLRSPSGSELAAIDMEPAWAVTTGNPGIVVAVIDTGTRYDHPDLLPVSQGGNLLSGYDMIADVAQANDGDGRDSDARDPGDWVTAAEANDPQSPFYQCTESDSTGRYAAHDSSWHGTETAGLIGATTHNGVGIASVGRAIRVLPVRALGRCGQGRDSDIIAGMLWAAGLPVPGVPDNPNPARVINLSLGGDDRCSAPYQDAVSRVTAAGVVVVASAGNNTGHAVGLPANCAGAIAVAGIRHVGTKVGFSSLGPEVAISAPAGNCVNTAPGTPCLYPIVTTTDSGTTDPLFPTYTDSFKTSLGTSFSAPLVAGAVGLMLSAQPSLTPEQVRLLLQSTARPFPTSAPDAGSGEIIPQCTAPRFDPGGSPIDQLQCVCTQSTCGAGMLDAGAAVEAAAVGFPASGLSAQGLWWHAPAGSESGWGIYLAHQGDAIFATWYTYDRSGNPLWLSMTASKVGNNVYSGALLQTTGPAFSVLPFNPALVTRTVVGNGTLSFTNSDHATFSYTVNGLAQAKRITRQVFGTLPSCRWGTQVHPVSATQFQDLWWNAPAGTESGWGVSVAQQDELVFAVWYTYDLDGSALWLSATLGPVGPSAWSGALYRTSGPPFSAVPFDPAAVVRNVVGTAALTFGDGNNGTFAYTVNGVSQAKPITRQLFYPPAATVCR